MTAIVSLAGKYLIGLIGIGFVVIIHELGHLTVARLSGISVEIFSFGLGPRIWGIQFHATEFRISLLPFGGYCRMKGADDLTRALDRNTKTFEHTEIGSLFSVHPIKRFITYAAGPLTNILFAILLYAMLASVPYSVLSTKAVIATVNDYPALFGAVSSPGYDAGLRTGDQILEYDGQLIRDWEELELLLANGKPGQHTFLLERDKERLLFTITPEKSDTGIRFGLSRSQLPIVGSVRPNTPEKKAGLMAGDLIVACNGLTITNDLDLMVALSSTGEKTSLTVLRNGIKQEIKFKPNTDESGNGDWAFSLHADTRRVEGSPFSLMTGIKTTYWMTFNTIKALAMILTGKAEDVRQEFTGMVRAALMIGDITSLGLESNVFSGLRALLYLLGIVSISLAIGNMIPLPAFDGGQMLIGLYETISRKRVRPQHYWVLQLIGFFAVILIFGFMTYVDLHHLYLIRH
ncbi:RIP metalloprotease RseP [Sphaerochaeta pleomorpha str. Grapes]|uniref:Zinc metalloprotease n=1 Tax=Sphaerochaeta pleomorpha (strain ATCC BAA-1885 / DSM 22778 / Grapes) TaxID=158190 RepID=G8QXY6_SPHPG|nr:RIP metalloprotease RseP [Sphaerochaeta pleomorpha]AEV28491.1 RIP metalloprotease RseP [Sphaerochaeta pleomorpha str. Grapes]